VAHNLNNRFWSIFSSLTAITVIFTLVSWIYITTQTHLTGPKSSSDLLTLPTRIPSIWNIVRPNATGWWLAPLIVLIIQIILTGGLYGTLVRVNTRQVPSISSFISDAVRNFGRLLLWNLLWTALSIALIGTGRGYPSLSSTLAGIVVALRFVFLFADVALVSERSIPYAIKSAVATLFNRVISMIPYAVVIAVLSGAAFSASTVLSSPLLLVVSAIYCAIMTFILHMITARYLVFSGWFERQGNLEMIHG
jgi:hypothetical protein